MLHCLLAIRIRGTKGNRALVKGHDTAAPTQFIIPLAIKHAYMSAARHLEQKKGT